MIRSVVFDLGGVVCTFDPERRLHALARGTGLEARRIHDAIWTSGLDARAEAGEFAPADLERALLDALDNRVDSRALRAAWSAAFAPDPALCDIVKRLDVPVFGFTNNGPMFTACLEHELSEVNQIFERVICSWQVRARKPARVAFERCCAEVGVPPEELLFVDDDAKSAESARSVGMTAVTFTTAQRLANELEQLQCGGS